MPSRENAGQHSLHLSALGAGIFISEFQIALLATTPANCLHAQK